MHLVFFFFCEQFCILNIIDFMHSLLRSFLFVKPSKIVKKITALKGESMLATMLSGIVVNTSLGATFSDISF